MADPPGPITRAIGEVRPLLAGGGYTLGTGLRLRTLAEVVGHLGAGGKTGVIGGTEIRGSGVPPSAARTATSSSPARPAGTRSRPPSRMATAARRTGTGRRTSGGARRIPRHEFGWSTASPTGGTRWALARHLGRREHMGETIIQAVAGLLSHQQTTDLNSARKM